MGDSIDDFVNLRPEKRLVPLLAMAVPRWSPATTCIHGFEPNPRWVKRLQNVTRRLHSRTASLTVHYAGVTTSLRATPPSPWTAVRATRARPLWRGRSHR